MFSFFPPHYGKLTEQLYGDRRSLSTTTLSRQSCSRWSLLPTQQFLKRLGNAGTTGSTETTGSSNSSSSKNQLHVQKR